MKKKNIIDGIGIAIVMLAIIVVLYAFSGLCMWGIGNFVIWVFEIDYEWTYLHGLATSIVLSTIGNAFKSRSSNK